MDDFFKFNRFIKIGIRNFLTTNINDLPRFSHHDRSLITEELIPFEPNRKGFAVKDAKRSAVSFSLLRKQLIFFEAIESTAELERILLFG